jgi:hypothetical protein
MRPRLLAVAILVLVSLAMSIAPAGAKQPTRGCPPPFVGPLTIAEVITAFPPPPGFPDPEGAIEAYDSNGDGTVCVMPLPAESINVIDNVART